MAKEDFFSPKHNRLLNIAAWAKYLAWVVLVIYLLLAIGNFISYSSIFYYPSMVPGEIVKKFFQLWDGSPMIVINGLLSVAGTILQGITGFLVLKAISLGLNMIVETDINYREMKSQEVGNE
jgi:hypothetical protein